MSLRSKSNKRGE